MRSLSGSRTGVGEASAVIRDREDPAFKVIQIPRKRHQGRTTYVRWLLDGAPGKMRGMRTLLLGSLALVAAALIVAGPAAGASNKTITVKMTGKQETPKGDPDGSGTAKITLEPSAGKVCFKLTWSHIGAPQASHIHKGARGKAGNVVVVFFGTPPAKHSACVKASKSLITARSGKR